METEAGKTFLAATETEVQNDPSLTQSAERPNRNLRNAIYTIVCGVALPCIPVIVVSAVLLYIILKHRIVPQPGWPELYTTTNKSEFNTLTSWINEIRHQGGKPAYFVQYNPSTVTTIAAWTGRVIPYLSSSIMALVAFFAARHMVHKSKHGRSADLPTPDQLTILIGLLGGSGIGPLKDTILYRYGRKEKLVSPVPAAFAALALITLLGLLIPIVDTWFGVSVQPVVITQLSNNTAQINSYGRVLSNQICSNGAVYVDGDYTYLIGCNMFHGEGGVFLMEEAVEPARLLAGHSSTNTILNVTSNSSDAVYFLADVSTSRALDFKAKTLAISTQCSAMTTKCIPNSQSGFIIQQEANFSCTPGFSGNLSMQSAQDAGSDAFLAGLTTTGIGFSLDASFNSMIGAGPSPAQIIPVQNPLYFAAWAYGFPELEYGSAAPPQFDGEVLVEYAYASGVWILNCSSTVWEMTYTWADGAVLNYTLELASPGMAGMISTPFSRSIALSNIAETQAATVAGFANNIQQLSTNYANGFSSGALALSAGVMVPVPNIIEQHRNSTISVARIPLVPLYLLLSLKALYVMAVIVLAIGAYCFTHPAETDVVKEQLSVKGLVAAHFDQPSLLQANVVKEVQSRLEEGKAPKKESSSEPSSPTEQGHEEPRKIGIMADASGTWKYVTLVDGVWKSIQPLVQAVVLPDAKTGQLGEAGDIYAAWKV